MWFAFALLLLVGTIHCVPPSGYRQPSTGAYGGRLSDDNFSLLSSLLDSLGDGGLDSFDYYDSGRDSYGNEIAPPPPPPEPLPTAVLEEAVCEPQVVTNTQLVHSTVFATRTEALPTTVFTMITQTLVVSETVFQDQVISSVAPPVVQTRTDVVTDTAYITRARYITETAFVTQTEIQYVTTTVRDIKTQRVTRTETRYNVKTKYDTRYETLYKTVESTTTLIHYVTQQQQVPHYITKSIVSSYPVIQTVTNSQILNNYHTVTLTSTAYQQKPVYQTVYKTQFAPQYVTYTDTVKQEVPVYHTYTSYKVQFQYVTKTVQAPCAPQILGYH